MDDQAALSQPLSDYRANAIDMMRFTARVAFVPARRRRSSPAPADAGGMLPSGRRCPGGTRCTHPSASALEHPRGPGAGP